MRNLEYERGRRSTRKAIAWIASFALVLIVVTAMTHAVMRTPRVPRVGLRAVELIEAHIAEYGVAPADQGAAGAWLVAHGMTEEELREAWFDYDGPGDPGNTLTLMCYRLDASPAPIDVLLDEYTSGADTNVAMHFVVDGAGLIRARSHTYLPTHDGDLAFDAATFRSTPSTRVAMLDRFWHLLGDLRPFSEIESIFGPPDGSRPLLQVPWQLRIYDDFGGGSTEFHYRPGGVYPERWQFERARPAVPATWRTRDLYAS